jgi:hypothetical protein
MRTLVGETTDRREADAARATSDDRYTAFETAALAVAPDSSSGINPNGVFRVVQVLPDAASPQR